MKKLLIALALATTLTASAFAYNAPLTAAQFESGAPTDNTDGTLQIELVKKSAYLDAVDKDGKVYVWDDDADDFQAKFLIPSDAFDVVARFSEVTQAIAGYDIKLFFNPERIQTLLTEDENIYGLYDSDGDLVAEGLSKSIYYKADATYADYLKNNEASVLAAYNNISKDGFTTAVVANGANFPKKDLRENDLARWTFTETDSMDNNWYRTKIYLNYKVGDIANIKGTKVNPSVDGAVYYENPDYTGPKFDIVGGMKKADGELRFGSVYFTGDTYFDTQAEIVEAGIVCYPTALLDDKVLTLETAGAVKIPATGYYDNSTDGELVYTGVLSGLESATDMYITAKSYITYKDKDGSKITVYSDPIARSLGTASTESMK